MSVSHNKCSKNNNEWNESTTVQEGHITPYSTHLHRLVHSRKWNQLDYVYKQLWLVEQCTENIDITTAVYEKYQSGSD